MKWVLLTVAVLIFIPFYCYTITSVISQGKVMGLFRAIKLIEKEKSNGAKEKE